jgi:hypothetical protein
MKYKIIFFLILLFGVNEINAQISASFVSMRPQIQTQFFYTGTIVNWTVPNNVNSITITAKGAQGGSASNGIAGGNGAIMQGTFSVTPGQVLSILVGQQPTGTGTFYGGGGGTFVALGSNYTIATPLIVAGGGGGNNSATYTSSADATTSTTGQGPVPGTNGNGASSTTCGGGGGGFYSNGGVDINYSAGAGSGFRQGGAGGIFSGYQSGGFGGGAPANYVGSCNIQGGAGGGYSGGSGLNSGAIQLYGFGGGSYNGGSSPINSVGNTGNGSVIITTSISSTTDAIKSALVANSSTSLTAYNNAADGTWIEISQSDYNYLNSNVSGSGKYIFDDNTMNQAGNNSNWGGVNYGISPRSVSGFNYTDIPSNNYIYAFAIQFAGSTNIPSGTQIFISTSNTSGFTTQIGGTLPSVVNTSSAKQTHYFVVKNNTNILSGINYLGVLNTTGLLNYVNGYGMNWSGGSTGFTNTLSGSSYFTPMQVLATGAKQW